MAFETVRIVPEERLSGREGQRYLREGDFDNLERRSLLYFLRRSRSLVLTDYPAKGGYERRVLSSDIEGPFESAPEIGEQHYLKPGIEEALELLIPAGNIPEFERVSLIEYGTTTDEASLHHLYTVAGPQYFMHGASENMKSIAQQRNINPEAVTAVGREVLDSLRLRFDLKQISDSQYRASTDGFLLEFSLRPTYFYPSVSLRVFGDIMDASNIFFNSGIYALDEQFRYLGDRDVGIRNSERMGLAYNLSLDGRRSIDETVEAGNVVL